ncbi:putative alanine racemase-domain-containing protein [Thamnocephalis sphaerospora]|uniref:Putative alanine racemase-domain-containing protein n=1 Tax=Thamnocephalis sphaerospora TaxID=78915 RepID=A0A4P9XMR3_9FUNG|nr:putative alanine racemase-domain-containing protein [Thamnocephalis sphaerospora]|eukprot:RKP07185.1 putative alanine racemase-domain-containing protein [Thamnocephalis sphaerospora]
MVPTAVDDCINRPLAVVRRLFEEHWTPNTPVEHTWNVPEHFEGIFDTEEKQRQIPTLNTLPQSAWRPGTLVRFRGMVQDTSFGQEISVDVARATSDAPWQPHRYSDGNVDDAGETGADHHATSGMFDLASTNVRLNELQLVYCVSVPGEQPWARRMYAQQTIERGTPESTKAAAAEASVAEDDDACTEHMARLALDDAAPAARLVAKHPLAEEQHSLGVVVKASLLGSQDTFAVTSTVEVIGVLGTVAVATEDALLHPEADAAVELPCIHAIFCRPLHAATENPHLLRATVDRQGHLIDSALDAAALASTAREALLSSLTGILEGDSLAAEYLLLMMISRVQHRSDVTAIGDLSLNFTKVPRSAATSAPSATELCSPMARRVHARLASLLPKCLPIPMALGHLNAQPFWPRDTGAGTDRLSSGRLQLTDGTFLFVDETALDEGRLEDNGVRNVRALVRIAQTQQLDYVFPFRGDLSFPTDLGVLVFSAARSMIPTDFVLPLQQPSAATATETAQPDHAELACWQRYLAVMRTLPHEIPDAMSQQIQEDFVCRRRAEMEQNTPLTTDAELSRELLVARLLAQSYGEHTLKAEHWEHAQRLEAERRARLST